MILFTGLTGKSGDGLINAMARHSFNEKFRVTVRANSNFENLRSSKLDFEMIVGNIEDEVFLRKVVEGCNTAFHIASKGLI